MIPTIPTPSRDEFHARKNTREAFIVRGLARDWTAFTHWTPTYLKAVVGGEQVQILDNRDKNPKYEMEYHNHRFTWDFRYYMDWIFQTQFSNQRYIHAQNEFFKSEGGKRLLEDIAPVPIWLDPKAFGCTFMWLGPAGTVTPLHHDDQDILFVQLWGSKRLTLYRPEEEPNLYPIPNTAFVNADPEAPDFEQYPLFRNAKGRVVDLHPGDALFLPVPWWHHVRALDISLSLSFTGFV